jgi:ubiquinone/menaquinone biosynthesis C-methylase UbiE
MDQVKKTEKIYKYLWEKGRTDVLPLRWHFHQMQERIPEPIVRGKMGIDIGSGCGYDTNIMARDNPKVKIVSLEISDGVYKTKKITQDLKNINIIKGSILHLPLKENTFDFGYSYGVLHHIPEPEKGLKELARILKDGSPVFLYLYEDHSEDRIKYWSIKIINMVRKITTKLSAPFLYMICFLLSPVIILFFTYPSKIMKKFKPLHPLAEKVPFNFGTHFFSLAGDLYDRFAAPIEHRFSREEVLELFKKSGFSSIKIEKMPAVAGWVTWGYKGKND